MPSLSRVNRLSFPITYHTPEKKKFISLLWIEVTSWLGLTNKQSKWNNTDPVASFAPGINSLRTVLFNPFT